MFVRPRERCQRGWASLHELDGTGNAYDRHMECVESGRRREDVAPVHWRVHQAGVHRWRPGLSTALQRPVRPDDIVRAAQEVDVPVELVGATGVAGRATAHVRRAWANREGETLDERGVQGLGILRLPPRSLQPTRRADPPAPFDSDDAIVPPSLEHMTRDARRPKEALTHPTGVLEPIGRDQRESHHASAEDDVVEDGRGVSRGAAAEHAPGPQSGTHLDGRTQPGGSALVADERVLALSAVGAATLRRYGAIDYGQKWHLRPALWRKRLSSQGDTSHHQQRTAQAPDPGGPHRRLPPGLPGAAVPVPQHRSRPDRPSRRLLRPRRAGRHINHLPDPPVSTDPARRRGRHRHHQPGDLSPPPHGHARRPLGLARHRARLPRPPPGSDITRSAQEDEA